LRAWGYKSMQSLLLNDSPVVSIGLDEQVVVGFITCDREGLATRTLPPFSFHVIRFTEEGQFISEHLVPTSSRNENSIQLLADGSVVIRAGDRLKLLSPTMELISDRDLWPENRGYLDLRPIVFVSPDRQHFLIHNLKHHDSSIELLYSSTLTAKLQCRFDEYDKPLGLSNRSLLYRTPYAPPTNKFVVAIPCSNIEYEYIRTDPGNSVAIVNEDLVLTNGPKITFLENSATKTRWQDSFDTHHEVIGDHIEVNADGSRIAVSVRFFVGENRFLDISGHLKGMKIVVYRCLDGKRLAEIPVNPPTPSEFGFSLSPSGDVVAVYADGQLNITKVAAGSEPPSAR